MLFSHANSLTFMPYRAPSIGPGRGALAVAAALSCLAVVFAGGIAAAVDANEVRALWVVRTTLSSPGAIDTMVKAAGAAGFNTLLVQVRGRADAYYANGLEPRATALAAQPAFDPLAVTIDRAHAAGLKAHAWVNVNLISSATELPTARDHLIYRRPEWLMVPRAAARQAASADPAALRSLLTPSPH